MKDSDNPISADNQQETVHATLSPWWIVGFVDGEGCFSISIHKNELARPTGGWQIQPTFQVSQHTQNRHALEEIRKYFGVGTVRSKGQRSSVDVYLVHSTIQIEGAILPFFETYPLRTKHDDFEAFARIVRFLRNRAHHDPDIFKEIVGLAYTMNLRGKQRKRPIEEILTGSSETTRQAPS